MLHYTVGSYYEPKSNEYACSPQEWARLKAAKNSVTFYTEAGTKVTIRKQRKNDEAKDA